MSTAEKNMYTKSQNLKAKILQSVKIMINNSKLVSMAVFLQVFHWYFALIGC